MLEILFILLLDVCSINNEICCVFVEYFFSVLDNCILLDLIIEIYYDEYFDGMVDFVFIDIFGIYFKWKFNGDWLIGEYEFEIWVEDGCGNEVVVIMLF